MTKEQAIEQGKKMKRSTGQFSIIKLPNGDYIYTNSCNDGEFIETWVLIKGHWQKVN